MIRRTVFAHERIATEAARRLGQLGIPLDFSPASLAGVDCYLDVLLPSGEALDASSTSSELDDQILLFGSYVGETFRKRFGGDWNDPGSGEDLASRIQIILPDGEVCYPLRPVYESLLRVPPPALRCLDAFDQIRDQLGQGNDTPPEAPHWVRFASILLGAGQPGDAYRLLCRATALDPSLGAAWFARGQAEEKLDNPRAAVESFRKAQRLLDPGDSSRGEIQLRLARLAAHAAEIPPEEPTPSPALASAELELIPELTDPPPAPSPVRREAGADTEEDPPTAAAAPAAAVVDDPIRIAGATQASPQPPNPAAADADAAADDALAAVLAAAAPLPPSSLPRLPPVSALPAPEELPSSDLLTVPPPPPIPSRPGRYDPSNAPSIRILASPRSKPGASVAAEESGESQAESLLELAREGQIEILDALLDETREDWSTFEQELFSWLKRLDNEGTAEEQRGACGVAMLLADRKGFRTNALAVEAEDSLRLLEKTSMTLGSSLPPLPRARLMLALAAAYSDRAEGDRERNQKEALQLVEGALFLIDARTHPEVLGRAHKLLGNIHRKRGGGPRKDHADAAIGAFRAALRVFSPATHPEQWAAVQLDLGNTLRHLHSGDRNENNEQAIEAFTAGLKVLDQEQHPLDWGLLKLALGQSLLERDVADRTASLERAILTLQEAVDALPPSSPEAATAHHRLGLAFQRRKTGDRAENLQNAIEHYTRGLPLLPPDERLSTEENLDAARRELKRKR